MVQSINPYKYLFCSKFMFLQYVKYTKEGFPIETDICDSLYASLPIYMRRVNVEEKLNLRKKKNG